MLTERSPRQLLEGHGTVEAIGPLTASIARRVLVVTDEVVTRLDGFRSAMASLKASGVEAVLFDGARADVPLDLIETCRVRALDVAPDAIIAIGGGSVIDLAKLVAAVLVHPGSPRDWYGENLIPGPTVPVVAVPTTAGTGSEVTTVAVLSDPDRALKVGISSVHLIPTYSVCDPDLTVTCPPRVTAEAGIDAVCHAVEALTVADRDPHWSDAVDGVSIGRNSVSDARAVAALELLASGLPAAVQDGSDAEARDRTMRGATLAGRAFAHSGVGLNHALQYPLGARTGTSHGLGVGLLIPFVLTEQRTDIAAELTTMSSVVGAGDADGFLTWIRELALRIGLPRSLRDIGVGLGDVEDLASLTLQVTRLIRNHRGEVTAERVAAILRAAIEGDPDLLR